MHLLLDLCVNSTNKTNAIIPHRIARTENTIMLEGLTLPQTKRELLLQRRSDLDGEKQILLDIIYIRNRLTSMADERPPRYALHFIEVTAKRGAAASGNIGH